ncbi:DUF262 domain-containing protein [Elizabethkingia anophelis]|uniref:DUF262 domain-containing protein n=1 Tax=Elizabethkingia anophelis TaxID=1117645 RepID=UPI0020B34C46|nr:DUF262 domain-containing protein [Elizabethkingia anophelis]MCT3662507.1 DUF262 domain-containing protein [Elizabethkingia anophelis]UTF93938.1 DUF262 domain-containing protein [Elizabethkingia anophelis]
MYNQIEIKTDKDRISGYILKFEKGLLQVPAFQRDFVWENEDKINLFDSIKKNYPIGSLLLWQPDFDTEEEYDNFSGQLLGGYNIPYRKSNSQFILDGFQRLSTLIGCLLHPDKAKEKGIIRNDEEWFDKFNIVYNLKDELFEINRNRHFRDLKFFQIPIYKLVDAKEFFQFQKKLYSEQNDQSEMYLSRYEEISLIFQNYEIPSINLYGGTISEAIEIFQRLNSKGAPITTDWVISASLFKRNSSFRLGSEINKLIDDLSFYNFQNIKRDVILNCIINSFGGIYFDQVSRNNNKRLEILVSNDNFIPITLKTFESIKKAVKFLYEELLVLDVKLLPYNNQLIFITDFFNKINVPTKLQLKQLKKWFWITTYSNYFTIYNLSKQRIAYYKFQKFIDNQDVDPVYYEDGDSFETQKFPDKISMGSVRSKALSLFMLNYSINKDNILEDYSLKADSDIYSGYKTYKLFNNKENMLPANTVFVPIPYSEKIFNKSLRQKDLSFLLDEPPYTIEDNYFINEEMKNNYWYKRIDQVLDVRRNMIRTNESKFVEEKLGIRIFFDIDDLEF